MRSHRTATSSWPCKRRGPPSTPLDTRNDHLVAGLRRAVSIGDDTDTVAAIAGYLLGACYGFSAVPIEWSSDLAGWPVTYGVDDLVQLATSAVELGVVDVDE